MKAGFIFWLASAHFVLAQNLVPNSGFEQYFDCPTTYNAQGSARNFAPGWYSPTQGTPDLFNKCSFGNAGVPQNWAGVAHAHKGFGYSGIYAWMNNSNYREYLQTKLTDSLLAGTKYKIEFFYRLSVYSKYTIDRIGVLVSDSLQIVPHDRVWLVEPSHTHVIDSSFQKQAGVWNVASFDYVAKGGERFISIGNFSPDAEIKKNHYGSSKGNQPMLERAAYFYIDDVSVTPVGIVETDTKDLSTRPEIKPNEVYILKHIYFAYNSFDLMPLSYEELNVLLSILKKNPTWKVELSGHTDDKGDNLYNYNLSLNRAKSVGRYLVQNGIAVARIKTVGFGKRKPLKTARTEEARATNRRVEVKFSSK